MKIFGIIVGTATIIAAIYAVLQYHSGKPSLRVDTIPASTIPEQIQKKKDSIVLSLDNEIYKWERNWIYTMYEVADKISYLPERNTSLREVSRTALNVNDFNMAIIAAEKISYSTTRNEALFDIVTVACSTKENFGYALLAADKISYASTRTEALKKVIDAAKLNVNIKP